MIELLAMIYIVKLFFPIEAFAVGYVLGRLHKPRRKTGLKR